jgi:hypothetical protein
MAILAVSMPGSFPDFLYPDDYLLPEIPLSSSDNSWR